MLDVRMIKENPEKVKRAMINRQAPMDDLIDELLLIDGERRKINTEYENLRAEQNLASKEIPRIKKEGGDTRKVLVKMKEVSDKIKELDENLSKLEEKQSESIYSIPNIPHESVPIGKDDENNEEVRKIGKRTKFEFEPIPHWELGEKLGMLDPKSAAKVTGARFHFLKDGIAKLERALVNLFLDTHTENGYREILAPFIVNRESMTATGQLPKFEEDAFKLENHDYFLIPTAEVPVTNLHRNEIIMAENLPIKYCAYSACFRAEAGSAGRDTRGLIRQHQFNKVELVKFTVPENSYDELEKLTADAERVLQLLELPYRVVNLCTGDLGFSSAKTYDIEVWMPSYNRYVEISSCSNFEDFQARRASIRYKEKPEDRAQILHTINGSGVAIGRAVAAIMENYQNEDGSINVPKVLIPYMKGIEVIK